MKNEKASEKRIRELERLVQKRSYQQQRMSSETEEQRAARLVQLRSFQQQRLSSEPCSLLIMSSLTKVRPHNVLHLSSYNNGCG